MTVTALPRLGSCSQHAAERAKRCTPINRRLWRVLHQYSRFPSRRNLYAPAPNTTRPSGIRSNSRPQVDGRLLSQWSAVQCIFLPFTSSMIIVVVHQSVGLGGCAKRASRLYTHASLGGGQAIDRPLHSSRHQLTAVECSKDRDPRDILLVGRSGTSQRVQY
ncbi:hypothetical protein EJ03DRAFT_147611 [Teratosphaeria nubilosa]|uniref:Uncharacterized protein n=1 Tax=Teratosphaeria nubilosa TaxID=161662 RepID=A0A6G1L4Q2_9PEZI|nr:hypothetical protein EJ03DRAFT_147611 [Teratosphaeria nubilosa]